MEWDYCLATRAFLMPSQAPNTLRIGHRERVVCDVNEKATCGWNKATLHAGNSSRNPITYQIEIRSRGIRLFTLHDLLVLEKGRLVSCGR